MGVDLYCHCRCLNLALNDLSPLHRSKVVSLLEEKAFLRAWELASEFNGRSVCDHPSGKVAVFHPGTFAYIEFLIMADLYLSVEIVTGLPRLKALLSDSLEPVNSIVHGDQLDELCNEIERALMLSKSIHVPEIDLLPPDILDYSILDRGRWVAAHVEDANGCWSFCVENTVIVICEGLVESNRDLETSKQWRGFEFTWDKKALGYRNERGDFCPCPVELWSGKAKTIHVPAFQHFLLLSQTLKALVKVCRKNSVILEVSF